MVFPDEFGEDIYQEGQEQPQKAAPANVPASFCGYLTPAWFGPFLLSPLRRRERGSC